MTATQTCPQCEAEIPAGARFCPVCGVRLGATPEPLPQAQRWWGGRKVVIWFLVIAAIFAAAFMSGVFYFIRHTTIVTTTKNGGGRMEAPFGVLSEAGNPAQLAHNLGLDIFPGATGVTGTQAEMNHSIIVSIEFRSTATPGRIISYYHVRYPDASVHRSDDGLTLVQLNPRDTLTLVAEPEGTGTAKGTRILVGDVRH
ncbi:MAG: zinc ribbon domain-containing protein [Terriglobales bacterium]